MIKYFKQITVSLCFLATTSLYAVAPADGLYTFNGATANNDGTATTSDGFFTINVHDGTNLGLSTSADQYGAYIYYKKSVDSGDTTTYDDPVPSGTTSYVELKVAATGSFYVTDMTLGEYSYTSASSTNNFNNIYMVGMANGSVVCQTTPVSSIGAYDTEYNTIDYSPCSGVLVDTVRAYFTTADANALLKDFNLVDLTISGASTNAATDNTPPTISSISVPSNGTHKSGDALSFTVNTSENCRCRYEWWYTKTRT
jgi:hypothetical protein